ncbi:hypothetical protein ABN214_15395 [Proteus terrae]|uniref:hypothetical protein n=1 Tax=Proteus terrae TaxID=1574161 RepID=UPI0032DABCB9
MNKSEAIIDIKTKIQVASLSVSVYEPLIKETINIYYSNMLSDVKRDIAIVTERINLFVDNASPTNEAVTAFHKNQSHVLSRIESRIAIIKNAYKQNQDALNEIESRNKAIADKAAKLNNTITKHNNDTVKLGIALSLGAAAFAMYKLITR